MGDDKQPREPGKGPIPDLKTPSGLPEIGKSTLAGKLPTSASAIGDAYIEGRAHCNTPGAAGCFLKPEVRPLLVNAYQQEVMAAQHAYEVALTEVKMERLIQKEEELPMVYSLMLDVLGTQLLAGVSSAFKMLQGSSEKEIAEGIEAWVLGADAPPDFSLHNLVTGVNEGAVGTLLKAGVDETKKSLKKPAPSGEKQVALSYIDRLQEASAFAWELQRQGPPGSANDAELIVLFHSFKAKMGHTIPRYVQALKQKIDRFMKSPASIIGREVVAGPVGPESKDRDAGKDPNNPNHGHWAGMQTFNDTPKNGFFLRDTKVVWVIHEGVALPELYYYKRDASHHTGIKASDYEKERLDLDFTDMGPADESDHEFKISMKVEPEFIETALAKHKETWGKDPETIPAPKMLVPPPPTPYVPPPIQKARDSKKQGAGIQDEDPPMKGNPKWW